MHAFALVLPLMIVAPVQQMERADHASPAACIGAALPAELAGWSRAKSLAAGAKAGRAPALVIGQAVDATLEPTPGIAYAVRPEKPGGPVSSGGLFTLQVAEKGRYRVAIDSGAWLDVLSGTTPMPSVAHGHGPDCSGVRKMVDFDLTPGRYLVQVAGNGKPHLRLLVTKMRA